jgi:hypothetical protein
MRLMGHGARVEEMTYSSETSVITLKRGNCYGDIDVERGVILNGSIIEEYSVIICT